MKTVSICIPAYNNPDGIQKLLDSISIQTFTDYEICISEDVRDESDSTKTKDIVDLFKKEHPEIEDVFYKTHKSTKRPGDNWNNSLDMASGEYIKMMLHDDWFTDNTSLECFVNMVKEGYDFAFSGTWQISEDMRYKRYTTDEEITVFENDAEALIKAQTIGAPSAVIFRNRNFRFSPNLKWLIDMDMYIRCLRNGNFTYTKKPLVSIGISDMQLTNYCMDNPKLVRKEYKYLYSTFSNEGKKKYKDFLKNI